MGRNLNPSCKKCRRSGQKLFLKGSRCLTAKCAIDKRNFPPGHKPLVKGSKLTEYGKRLREKQKLCFHYGVSDKQIRIYFKKSLKQKGITGTNLLLFLERRLDNVIYRFGLANSRFHARQLIQHNKILVNKRKVDIPSYLVKIGDIIEFKFKDSAFEKKVLDDLSQTQTSQMNYDWLQYDTVLKTVKVYDIPSREKVGVLVDDQLVVELLKTLVSR